LTPAQSSDFVGSSDFKELVRSRTNLVELVGETVSLSPRHGGNDYVGLCPFHDDHNPSFHVYPDRQSWRCWVCNEGGDCFSFLMRLEGADFRAVLEQLAQRANLEIPRGRGRSTGSGGARDRLLESLAWAENEFHQCLLRSPGAQRARDYLAGRGFTAESLARYRVGYHPNDWEWLQTRARGQYTPEQLLAARLVRERAGSGGFYDDFVDRVMFPIRDERSRVVAFGGRILPDHPKADAPKYLNSAESAVFSKSKLLYGLDVAREAVRRSGRAVVVEGYTDCIMAHQAGVENVVGTLGTALTELHVSLLRRFAGTVVLVYDGDEAGQNAALKSLTKFLAKDVDLRILTLPSGQDPADFFSKGSGAAAFGDLAEASPEAWEHQLRKSIDRHGLETTAARERVVEEMLAIVTNAPGLAGSQKEDILLNRMCQRVQIKEDKVRQRLSDMRKRPAAQPRGTRIDGAGASTSGGASVAGARNKNERLESELLQIVFASPSTVDQLRGEVSPEELENSGLRQLLETCYALAERGLEATFDRVMAELEDPELKRLAVFTDDLSRDHGVLKKLYGDGPSGAAGLLRQTLDGFAWRRHERSHETSKGEVALLAADSGRLSTDAKSLLRRAAEFHKERVKKRT
jgi:DNA primase